MLLLAAGVLYKEQRGEGYQQYSEFLAKKSGKAAFGRRVCVLSVYDAV